MIKGRIKHRTSTWQQPLVLIVTGLSLTQSVFGQSVRMIDKPAIGAPLVVGCHSVDAFCAAANLSILYSNGAAIAERPCPRDGYSCEEAKATDLARARSRYLAAREWLRRRGADRSYEASTTASKISPTDAALDRYVSQSLKLLREGSCKLDPQNCLRATVYLMADVDQAVRQNPSCGLAAAAPDGCLAKKQQRMRTVDDLTSKFVAKVLAREGWLGAARWGTSTEDSFFLLVQHADADLALQLSALSYLRAAVGKGEASAKHLGFLEDRVRVHGGLPQLYGTQGRCIEDKGRVTWRADPIADPSKVDTLRAGAKMEPFEIDKHEADEECSRS